MVMLCVGSRTLANSDEKNLQGLLSFPIMNDTEGKIQVFHYDF